jgi:hypothetical protein
LAPARRGQGASMETARCEGLEKAWIDGGDRERTATP